MTNRSVLISGASVAGPALAFWLSRFGWDVTIVEKSPSLRDGGYAVDFRGTAMEVLRRMGLLDAIKAEATNMGDMFYVNAKGKKTVRMPSAAFSGELEIMRGDLARIFYDATRADARYIFGDSIAHLDDNGDAATVTFESGTVRDYDLVVGADGVHSNVRAKAFGPERDYVRDLGLSVSIFTAPNRLGLDYSGQLYPTAGHVAGVYSARHNTEARATFYLQTTPEEAACREPAAQRAIIRRHFGHQGWVVPQLLNDMDAAPDFYFDSISQVHLDTWSTGRIVLLGDAAGCASPLSGMGTGMAVTGAYILAHELARTPDDHARAFAAYQQAMTPFVAGAQKFAAESVGHFAPKTAFGVFMHALILKFVLPHISVETMLKDVLAVANSVSLDGYGEDQAAMAPTHPRLLAAE